MFYYDYFYRRYGIRKGQQLLSPPMSMLELLDLPRSSILHYAAESKLQFGPPSDEFLFRHITKPIMVDHVLELGDAKGAPRKVSVSPMAVVRNFHIKNRRFKQMRDLQAATRDINTLVVCNYSVLPHLYRYARSIYSDYYQWWNMSAAMWKHIAQIEPVTERQHFIVAKLPKILPSMSDLKMGSTSVNQKMLKVFSSPEALTLLELWKWLGPHRGLSVMGEIRDKQAERINLIFMESGRWFVLNLGMLNKWRKATDEELALDPKAGNPKGLAPDQLQRRFLRMMVSLFAMRTAPSVEDPIINALPQDEVNQGLQTSGDPAAPGKTVVLPVETPKVNKETGAIESKPKTKELPAEAAMSPKEDNSDHMDGLHLSPEIEKQIDADLAHLEEISAKASDHQEPEEVAAAPVIEEARTLEHGVMRVCDRMADNGLLSAAEYRRYNQLANAYKSLPSPDGKTTLDKFIQVPEQDLKIEKSPVIKDLHPVLDKSMLASSLHTFDSKYVKHVLHKDIAAMSLNIQHAGMAVTDYNVERVDSVLGSFDSHAVRVVPIEGAATTLRFKVPVVAEDGTYMANGTKYRLRKQRGDLPLRKINASIVALTSYYGKTFVSRSDKRVNDRGVWLRNNIMAMGLDNTNTVVTNMHPGEVFDNLFVCPRLYSTLAMGFRSFNLSPMQLPNVEIKGRAEFELTFDHTQREKIFSPELIKEYEKNGSILVGKSANGALVLVMDKDDTFYVGKDGRLMDIGTIDQLLGLDASRSPVEFAELAVLGKDVPVGVVLAYELGLSPLMRLLKVQPRRVPVGTRVNLDEDEYSLVFADETLVFSKDDRLASMVLAGFNEYHRALRQFSVDEFDKHGVYLNVLEAGGLSVRYLRELDLMNQMFVDPITRDLLVEMKEPTDFRGLLMRSCELLLTDSHPDELDPAFQRIKGYERIAGAVYSNMVQTVRAHNGRAGKSRQPLDLNPFAVWKTLAQDPAVALVSDINPIQNLKEQEAVTYSGVGGRSSRSMTKHTRAYHKNDMGTISELTVDSSDVAINTYTSADPQFTSLRGMSRRYEIGKTGATALLSTSALISPGADRDDPKRVNFTGIQHAHGVACSGYTQMPVRTGYEQVIAHRTSDLFALTAKKPGKVVEVNDHGIIVHYDDGEQVGYEIGRRFGQAAGLTIPHMVKTNMKTGQKFKEGDLICYNEGFFEPDLLNPNNVVWKAGVVVKTALMESTQTLEDSSAISERVAKLLTTQMTKVKTVVVRFDQSVNKLVKVGDVLDSEDILCIIEDATTADNKLFDEESLDTLRVLANQAPQAKAKGVVERVEIFYHGDKEDMSQSLRSLSDATDREMAKRHRNAGKKPFTGSVDEGFRIEGEPLALDTVAIRIYITSDVPAGVGDKGVFGNQMKTVFGEILPGEIKTESGKVIDAIFGQKSIADRIVLSPEIIGTTTVLLDVIGKEALKAYKG